MQLSGNTILITGGSEGIGLELASQLAAENTVIVCGRSEDKLARAKTAVPNLITEVCDVTDAGQRQALVDSVLRRHPRFNVLINNAGGRQRVALASGDAALGAMNSDLALNFTAPVVLCQELLHHLRSQPRAAIVNVTTGLVHLPKAAQPFYCAAKAALHSYTWSLRWALRGSSVRVFEVFMTLVDTNFHQGALPKTTTAIAAGEAARLTLNGIRRDREDIAIKGASLARWLAFAAPGAGMAIVNGKP
jgi:uncharacterized oxidoreductase